LLRVVGQLGATYIVAEGPDGMYLIDQHAAHERIKYEQLLGEHAASKLQVQALLEPVVVQLGPEQSAAIAASQGLLLEWGIASEPFGGGSYLVRSLPAVLSEQSPQSVLEEIADGLLEGTDVIANTLEARLVTVICKRAAIKGGQLLGREEMQAMVSQLESCASPRTCPHGRPTIVYVSAEELARQFGRT
jgi:DNA mismatch repair protein MutL